jgi:two-component system, OmpR family, sensor histidine kinase SenX3
MRRMFPTLVVLALGLVALLSGLGSLQSIIVAERHEAHARVAAERNALQEYARRTLEQKLESMLHVAEAEIELGRGDPLKGTTGVLLIEDGRQRFPRRVAYAEGTEAPAKELYFDLLDGRPVQAEPASPWARRLELLEAFRLAVRSSNERDVEEAFREILRHRAHFVIDSGLDIPYMLALLDYFVQISRPHPDLLVNLLRDGLGDARVLVIEGLQPALVRRRARFTVADFQFLSGRVIALSDRAQTQVDDFRARAAEPVNVPLQVPHRLEEASLLESGAWYARPAGADRIVGVTVSVTDLLREIETQMRARALLEPEDRLLRPTLGIAPVPLSTLPIDVESPRFGLSRAASEHRFWVKTGFVAVSAALALIIVVLAFVLQSRKQRFVELKSDFVATVSHELRTPLASVRLMAETLERRTAGMAAARDYPTRIVREVDELGFLVENILSFNRLDKRRWKPRREPVALRDLVDEATQDLGHYGGRPVEVGSEALEGIMLHGDRELLKLLLRNLAKNACAYNDRSPIRIEVRPGRRGDAHGILGRRWLLEFCDNGIGIPVLEQRRIFADFYRALGTTHRGSGLGLAICRKTMEAHGGRIRVAESTPAGTVFELDFPATMVEHA